MSLYDDARHMDVLLGGGVVSLCVAHFEAHPDTKAPRRFLLIHGNPGHMDTWAPTVAVLRRYGQVAAFDLPGFGRSGDVPPQALGLGPLADATMAVADALGWEGAVDVVGHSHGGAVAQFVATRYPGRVSSLTLLATLGYPVTWSYRLLQLPGLSKALYLGGKLMSWSWLMPWSAASVATFMAPLFMPEGLPPGVVMDETQRLAGRPDILLNMARLTQGAPWKALMGNAPQIAAPTVFIHGAAEMIVPVPQARAVYDVVRMNNPLARFVTLPGAGHMLPFFHAEAVVQTMARCLGWENTNDA